MKSNEVIMTSINLADELVILLIFVNNEFFVNAVTMGRTKCECRRCVGRDLEQFSNSNNSCV